MLLYFCTKQIINPKIIMTEQEANFYLKKIEKYFFPMLKKEKGFKYLAIVKKEKKNIFNVSFLSYFFEFSYYNYDLFGDVMTENRVNEIIIEIKNKLNILEIVPEPSFLKRVYNKYLLKTHLNKVEFNLNASEKRITYFHSPNKNKGLKKCSDKIKPGDEIRGVETGTLGAIISLKHEKSKFLISNYHVLMGEKKLNLPIKDKNECTIAKSFWGLFNDEYDVAIARLINNNYIIGKIKYKFNKIIDIHCPDYKLKNVLSYGVNGPIECKIYSKNAIVRVGENTYKNQILLKNLYQVYGDSGSIIVEDNNGDKKNIIGIYIGGEGGGDIKVVNNLYKLFSNKKESFKDKYGRTLPEIEFEFFIN